jgi:ATP-dependent helicase/nuclease subunit A
VSAPVAKEIFVPTPEQRLAADPGHTVWVGASAGSGKTHVLTDRLMRLLLTGVEPASILCLTYTKAGASEMAARLFKRLSEWATCSDTDLIASMVRLLGVAPDAQELRLARSLFARALETPGGLKVQTIHAFCERLLQLFPVEAGLTPGFRVLDDVESAEMMREAIIRSMAMDDDETGWAFLAGGDLADIESLQQTIKGLLSSHPTMRAALLKPHGAEEALLKLATDLSLVPMPDTTQLVREINSIDVQLYGLFLQSAASRPDKEFSEKLKRIVEAREDDIRNALLDLFLPGGKRAKEMYRRLWLKNTDIEPSFRAEHDRVETLFHRLWAKQTFDATLSLYKAAQSVLEQLDRLKRQRGLYDFDDLITRTKSLLSSSVQAQWVLYKLDAGLSHVLVDEAQDTSPAQWTIVMALVEEFFAGEGRPQEHTRTVFVVGDRKQSIFSFQGADVAAFEQAREELTERVVSGGQSLKDVNLSVSYRSLATVLKAVDLVFAPAGEARKGFGEAGAQEPDHTAHRDEAIGTVEIWPPTSNPEKKDPDYWRAPVDRKPEHHPRRLLARQIAAEIHSWIGKRILPGAIVPVRPGDILILLQSRNMLFSALIAELRRLRVPVAGADKLELGKSIAVADLMALIQWITLPQDDHALACVLKSPIVPKPVTEAELITLAYGRETTMLWTRVQVDAAQIANTTRLKSYVELAAQEGPYGFLSRVTQLCRHDILARLGSEADDALRELLELALDYERREAPSLAGFARWFSQSEHTAKREMDSRGNEVRIMTVHGAKGLEAPIVFLADAGDTRHRGDTTRLVRSGTGTKAEGLVIFKPQLPGTPDVVAAWEEEAKQRARMERLRLLYVGMTRAKDALYVCSIEQPKNSGKESWWSLVSDAIDTQNLAVKSGQLSDGTTVRRLGDEPIFVDRKSATQDETRGRIPDWAKPLDGLPPVDLVPLHVAHDETTYDSASAREGIAIHRFFEIAPGLQSQARIPLARRLGLSADIAKRLAACLDDPQLLVFFGPESESEVSIASPGQPLRRIDRAARRDGVIYLLDFKSGARPGVLGRDHPYALQMAHYAGLMRQAYPGETVRAALLWTQDGALEWLSDDLLSDA